jgi:hypothetical protein
VTYRKTAGVQKREEEGGRERQLQNRGSGGLDSRSGTQCKELLFKFSNISLWVSDILSSIVPIQFSISTYEVSRQDKREVEQNTFRDQPFRHRNVMLLEEISRRFTPTELQE